MGRSITLIASVMMIVGIAPVIGAADDRPSPSAPPAAPPKTPAPAAPPKAGFWSVLVQPNARWVLVDTVPSDEPPAPSDKKEKTKAKKKPKRNTITVETFDVRTVGAARVARLRWTEADGVAYGQCDFGCMPRVAVTPTGLYFIDEKATDEQILEAIKRPPSRSEPPRPYKGTKQNGGRYLLVHNDLVCIGVGPLPDAGECEDVCFGEVCISDKLGIVQLSGWWAPDMGVYAQEGFRMR